MLDRIMPGLIVAAIIGAPSLLLALPATVRARSWALFQSDGGSTVSPPWATFGLALIQSAGGIVIPLLAFLASAFLVPDWKGACRLGAVDCFHAGKLALLPLVLWSMAAFYGATVWHPLHPHGRWVRVGLVHGAAISGVCVIHGFLTLKTEPPLVAGMLIPLYSAAWYAVTAYRVACRSEPRITPEEELTGVLSGVPFWLLAAALSELQYRGLPTSPPSCFVVTAASRGHGRLVGPLLPVRHAGRLRLANTQLLAFWSLEEAWTRRAPASHRAFRRVYNRIGPRAARHIRSRWTADALYLCLKPLEWAARGLLATR